MRKKIAIIISLIYFFALLFTLTDYGINWDTINHLPRGQAYLHYFLTGKRDYSDLSPYQTYFQNPDSLFVDSNIAQSDTPSRSYYQNDGLPMWYYLEIDGDGHPPLSDILASVSNRIFFGKLRLINDIDSYRIYGILLASITVGLVFYWVSSVYGNLAGYFSSFFLAMYPLFWSESHFNLEKDVPETAFWTLLLFSIWKGVREKSIKWILLSGIFFGLALGTKFNVLFIPLIVLPWLITYFGKKLLKKENLKLYVWGFIAIFIGVFIFYASWPYLWQDLVTGTQRVFGFYKSIGTTVDLQPGFVGPFKTNLYPLVWIITTTPGVMLLLFLFGIIAFFFANKKFDKKTYLFFLLWFLVSVIRVVWPGSNIYGGIRQIMEYVPAMAIIAGIGVSWLVSKKGWLKMPLALVVVIQLLFINISNFPHENTYFNSLTGGLSGAKEKNIPSWGNTFGSAYRPAFSWLNKNAPKGAKAVFVNELMPNAPLIWVRPDIDFHNTQRSGPLMLGEYAITLTYQGTENRSYYDSYLNKFISPVFESGVDGVPVVAVWKNSREYAKNEASEVREMTNVSVEKNKDFLVLNLGSAHKIFYSKFTYIDIKCDEQAPIFVEYSLDKQNWITFKEILPSGSMPAVGQQPSKGVLYYPFLGENAQYVRFVGDIYQTCLKNVIDVKVYILD